MEVIVDLTEVEEARGEGTTYFGGVLVIDGERKSVDGWTDRSVSPDQYALGVCIKKLGLSEDDWEDYDEQWLNIVELGRKYRVSAEDGKLIIEEVTDPIDQDNLELKTEVEKRAMEILKRATNALGSPVSSFTCGAGDWALVHDGEGFFLVNSDDDDDVFEVSIKVNIELK